MLEQTGLRKDCWTNTLQINHLHFQECLFVGKLSFSLEDQKNWFEVSSLIHYTP